MSYAKLVHVRTNGISTRMDDGMQTSLGPATETRLSNGIEIHYRASRNDLHYRFRRQCAERVWQSNSANPSRDDFSLVYSQPATTPDHPDPLGPGSTTPPNLFDIDTPGLHQFFDRRIREIRITDTVLGDSREPTRVGRSSSSAQTIVFRRNFLEWLEVRDGTWRLAGPPVNWFDCLHLQWRDNAWHKGPLCMIASGIQSLDALGA